MGQEPAESFCSVYGPVTSWRFGRSLGIDPIGPTSVCPFNCVYCQLGNIQTQSLQRQIFVPTEQVLHDLQLHHWGDIDDIDVVTLSGSGEPTLAFNLGEILALLRQEIGQPIVVLTNSVLLEDPEVRRDLTIANCVAAKLDATSPEVLNRINRPMTGVQFEALVQGLRLFRHEYQGCFALQTMLLHQWSPEEEQQYISLLLELHPDEVQLNVPSRPRPVDVTVDYPLESRGNHDTGSRFYLTQQLKCLDFHTLEVIASRLQAATGIVIRYPPPSVFTPTNA